jgi:hypothetical protein
MIHTIKEMVKDQNKAYLVHFQGTKLVYRFNVNNYEYIFPIEISDKNEVGDAVFELEHKAITLMRYIKKSIDSEEIRWQKII